MSEFYYQLYSSRKFPPVEETIRLLADLGYRGVEGTTAMLDTAVKKASLAKVLRDTGLTLPSLHVPLDLLENQLQEVADLITEFDIGMLYVPYLMPEDRPQDIGGYVSLALRIQAAAEKISHVKVGWHNHDFEFRRLADNGMPIEAMLDSAPALVWEIDVAWIVKAGIDPHTYIERYADRISAVHVKDIAKEGSGQDEDGWSDVGCGIMDWPQIMASLKKTRAELFIMEHDNPSDDKRFAKVSITQASAW